MAQQTINLGTVANDGTGDTLRAGGTKINANFSELYAAAGGGGVVSGASVPSGRLTLVSVTPVLTSDQTAKTSVYYTPYRGNAVPVYGGASWSLYSFSELTLALDTTNHTSGSLYDVYIWNNAGTISIGTGPAWSSSTARGTGAGTTELQRLNGLWTNKNSITLKNGAGAGTAGIAANTATYVGTIYCTANGQTGMAFKPARAATGTNNILGVYNAYNRRAVRAVCRDSTANWTVTTASYVSSNNSSSNRISFVDGLAESSIDASYSVAASNPTPSLTRAGIGIGLDITSGSPTATAYNYASSSNGDNCVFVRDVFAPQQGFHFLQAMETSESGGTSVSFFTSDVAGTPLHHLIASLEM